VVACPGFLVVQRRKMTPTPVVGFKLTHSGGFNKLYLTKELRSSPERVRGHRPGWQYVQSDLRITTKLFSYDDLR